MSNNIIRASDCFGEFDEERKLPKILDRDERQAVCCMQLWVGLNDGNARGVEASGLSAHRAMCVVRALC